MTINSNYNPVVPTGGNAPQFVAKTAANPLASLIAHKSQIPSNTGLKADTYQARPQLDSHVPTPASQQQAPAASTSRLSAQAFLNPTVSPRPINFNQSNVQLASRFGGNNTLLRDAVANDKGNGGGNGSGGNGNNGGKSRR